MNKSNKTIEMGQIVKGTCTCGCNYEFIGKVLEIERGCKIKPFYNIYDSITIINAVELTENEKVALL